MIVRNIRGSNIWPLRRYSASLLEKKLARDKRRQEKELARMKKLEEAKKQTKIATDLSTVEYTRNTPSGEKKDITCPLPLTYSPKFVEACWYEWWEKEGFFKPSKHRRNSEVFSMVIPPPNVTGKLHLGHALTVALEDVMCRWNRMRGREVVWVPGCDHAGIATQSVVEKLLESKNVTRGQLGRENFLREVWKWKDTKEEEIYDQLRILGASLDWTRTNFTLDQKFSRAVREAFIRLHEKGIIYRDRSLINWSCRLQSTISDIEIDNRSLTGPTLVPVPGYSRKVEFGVLHTFDYPLVNPTSEMDSVSVSTTRIETMLGDTAVAVHPDDPRYSSVIGSYVRHPLLKDVILPIIADSYVEKDFGTGAVKITPAHDFHDFEAGIRHNLPMQNVLDDQGSIVNTGNPTFDKLPRFEARYKVIEALKEAGLYRGKRSHEMNLPLCSRSGDVIEPRIKTQWFLKIRNLADEAIKAVETGQIRFEPGSYTAAWNNWLSESGDWCISRQLWWGHRIPAYKVTRKDGESRWISAHSEEEAKEKAVKLFDSGGESVSITQDEDVLDTWFSSALFPFACFGWPEETENLERYYPLSVMETGYDLIFFWVARMAMMGLSLTGEVPFKTVYLHTMVRDSQGRKMSKSLGNVIDPLQVIYGCTPEELDSNIKKGNLQEKEEKYALRDRSKMFPQGIPECGTDALRFDLCSKKNIGKDVSLDVKLAVQSRYFCNKIWNVFKYLSKNITKQNDLEVVHDLRPVDLWILSRLSAAVETVNTALEEFHFSVATGALQTFFLHDFADFYLESCKAIFVNGPSDHRRAVERNFEFIFESFLRLLSPFMPYLSEELWQRLTNRYSEHPSIMLAEYPTLETHNFRKKTLEGDIDTVRSVIQQIRSMKQLYQLPNQTEVTISCPEEKDFASLSNNSEVISLLTKSDPLSVSPKNIQVLSGCLSYEVPDRNVKVFIKAKGLINVDSQYVALSQKRIQLKDKLEALEKTITSDSGKVTKNRASLKIEKAKHGLSVVEKMLANLEQLR